MNVYGAPIDGLPRAFDCEHTHESPTSSVRRKGRKQALWCAWRHFAWRNLRESVVAARGLLGNDVNQIEITARQHCSEIVGMTGGDVLLQSSYDGRQAYILRYDESEDE
jgi:hypothetical protein